MKFVLFSKRFHEVNLLDNHSEIIQSTMNEIIDKELLIDQDFKKLIISFVKQECFNFGELCLLHFLDQGGRFGETIIKAAAAIELIIVASNIIDDLQDQDQPNRWGDHPALTLNSAIAILTLGNKTLRSLDSEFTHTAMSTIEYYSLSSINGQHLDLLNQASDQSTYLEMIELKSASLCIMSCAVGSILATGEVSKEVLQYAKNLGIIQQIKNDLQSLHNWNHSNDLLNRKYSLPVIYLMNTNHKLVCTLKQYYQGDNVELNLSELKDFIQFSGAYQYTIAIKNVYKHKTLILIENNVNSKELQKFLINLMK